MARLIDMYISDSLEVVEKLKNKLNLLKSPMGILNQQEIEELKELREKDIDYFTKLEKYFDITNPTNDIIEVENTNDFEFLYIIPFLPKIQGTEVSVSGRINFGLEY